MKIRRFNEANEISNDRVSEIIEELKELNTYIDDKSRNVDSLISEISNFKNSSSKSNDQIDDNIATLQILKKNLIDSIDKIDNVILNFESYIDEGRKYLYSETK